MLQKISSVFVVYRRKTLTGSPDPMHAIGMDKPCTTSSSEGESDATSDNGHTPSLEDSPRDIDYEKTPKLPSFTGSESWKVWFNCFDDVVCRGISQRRNDWM